MHHVIVYGRRPGSTYLKDAQPGIPFVPVQWERVTNNAAIRRIRRLVRSPPIPLKRESTPWQGLELLTAYVPGLRAEGFDLPLAEAAKLVPAGSDLVFQLHCTTKGQSRDRPDQGRTQVRGERA
jgi:hypothetical protein